MPQAKSTEFNEEFNMLEEERTGVKEERLEPVEVLGNEIRPLNYGTVVQHLRRHFEEEIDGDSVILSPNGGSKDAEAFDAVKEIDLSIFHDDAAQVKLAVDIEEAERRRDEEIGNPEAYVEKIYGQIVDELVERERKLEKAAENYVSNVFNYENPVDRLESDFEKHGGDLEEVINSYFGEMRPSELGLAYAIQFELSPNESVDDERRDLEGKIPLHDALTSEDAENRNRLYFQRYLEKVLEKTDEREEISDELREYWQDLS